jgi:hypothetical protein
MAFINIIGRKEPVKVSNEIARVAKKRWLGEENTAPADKDDILDLGDTWAGKYGQIKSIELEIEKKYEAEADYEPKVRTEAEKQMIRQKLQEAKSKLFAKGVFGSK